MHGCAEEVGGESKNNGTVFATEHCLRVTENNKELMNINDHDILMIALTDK